MNSTPHAPAPRAQDAAGARRRRGWMRVAALAAAMLLAGAPRLAAQSSLATPMDPRLVVAPAEQMAEPAAAYARRDHVAGAMKGLVVGAVVGGLGFAAVTYLGNSGNSEGQGYAVLAIPVGAVVGGAVGFVAGAIIGLPERDRRRAQVVVMPDAARGLTAAVSVPLGTPR